MHIVNSPMERGLVINNSCYLFYILMSGTTYDMT